MLAMLLPALPAVAQERKGSVTGTVKDEAGGALTSALVELQPLGRKVASDGQGQFRMTDVPAGEYTLSVSYVGLAASNVRVTVQAGQEASANAVLQVASQNDQVILEFGLKKPAFRICVNTPTTPSVKSTADSTRTRRGSITTPSASRGERPRSSRRRAGR